MSRGTKTNERPPGCNNGRDFDVREVSKLYHFGLKASMRQPRPPSESVCSTIYHEERNSEEGEGGV